MNPKASGFFVYCTSGRSYLENDILLQRSVAMTKAHALHYVSSAANTDKKWQNLSDIEQQLVVYEFLLV
jgi:hypothetical protein